MNARLTVAVVFCLLGPITQAQKLDGTWLLELEHNDIGQARTVMFFRTEGNSFTAHTRKNADRSLLGWWTSILGRTFTKSFKKGSLLRVVNGEHKVEHDTLKLSGILTSALGNYYFKGFVIDELMNVNITNRKGEVRGQIKGRKGNIAGALEDYHSLFQTALVLTNDRIYNREVLKTKKWKTFEKRMGKVSYRVQDDLEMVFAFFYYAGKLPFSHYALMKIPERETTPVSNERFVTIEEKSPETAYMNISSFGGRAEEMDSAFKVIASRGYRNLIVDLRDNSGGSVEAGMAFATNIFDSTFYGGVFLTQKWFNAHSELPAHTSYSTFPHFTESNFDLIIDGIHTTEGLCLKIVPKQNVYKGKLYVLTNRRTASTCEPIVYGLKQKQRATLAGEKTAGAMLNGEVFEVSRGFKLAIPTADYFASDGFRIDQVGVRPDVDVKQEEALHYVLKNIIK